MIEIIKYIIVLEVFFIMVLLILLKAKKDRENLIWLEKIIISEEKLVK